MNEILDEAMTVDEAIAKMKAEHVQAQQCPEDKAIIENLKGDDDIIFLLFPSDNSGFCFCVLEWVTKQISPIEGEDKYAIIFHGYGFFDGIRHLYMSDGEDLGYINYPDLNRLAKVLIKLKEYEVRFCREVEPSAFAELDKPKE